MSSQTPLVQQAHQAASPTASSAGSNPAVSSPTQDSNRSGTPGSNRGGSSASAASAAAQKQVLTEEQKKANHIASEKKRRNNIREQYDKLAEMIPGMAGQGRSEGRVLEEAVKMATQLVQERENIIAEIKAKGGTVDTKLYDEIDKALKVIRDNTLHLGRSDSQGTTPSQLHYNPSQALHRSQTNIYMKQANRTNNDVKNVASEGYLPQDTYLTETAFEMYPTPPGTRSANVGYGMDPRLMNNAPLPWPPPPPSLPLLRQPLDPYARFSPHDQHADLVSSRPEDYYAGSGFYPTDSFTRGLFYSSGRLATSCHPECFHVNQTSETGRDGSETSHAPPVLRNRREGASSGRSTSIGSDPAEYQSGEDGIRSNKTRQIW